MVYGRREPPSNDETAVQRRRVANAFYATEGRLVRFTTGTSFAAARVSHRCGRIAEQLPEASVDLIIVGSAMWPQRLNSVAETVRIFGYGVPQEERALRPGAERCLITIEDEIRIDMLNFSASPSRQICLKQIPVMLRVSVILSYRPPVRKTNAKYRGTVLEWSFSKRDETLQRFRQRGATKRSDEDDEPAEEQPIGDWNWTIGKRSRTRGTAQRDWVEATAADFTEELYLAGRATRLALERETR